MNALAKKIEAARALVISRRLPALRELRAAADRAQSLAWRKGSSEKVNARRDADCALVRAALAEEESWAVEVWAVRASGGTAPRTRTAWEGEIAVMLASR
jgi:hypothetical protein